MSGFVCHDRDVAYARDTTRKMSADYSGFTEYEFSDVTMRFIHRTNKRHVCALYLRAKVAVINFDRAEPSGVPSAEFVEGSGPFNCIVRARVGGG